MGEYYYLEGKEPQPCADVMEWAEKFDRKNRRVAYDEKDGVNVSTVFLGLDHSFDGGPPLLFETMIFGGEHDGWQDRYSSWDAAEDGHKAACKIAFGD